MAFNQISSKKLAFVFSIICFIAMILVHVVTNVTMQCTNAVMSENFPKTGSHQRISRNSIQSGGNDQYHLVQEPSENCSKTRSYQRISSNSIQSGENNQHHLVQEPGARSGRTRPNYRHDGNTSCYIYKDKKQLKGFEKLKTSKCAQRLSDALIIGVKKGGTVTLQAFLDLHPDLETITVSDTNFETNMAKLDIDVAIKNWRSKMPFTTSKQLTIAGYPGFFDEPELLYFMQNELVKAKNLKFIVILRDPVERAISDWVHIHNIMSKRPPPVPVVEKVIQTDMGKERVKIFRNYLLRETFKETVMAKNGTVNSDHPLISKGVYAKYLMDMFNLIDRNDFLVLDGDYFKRDPVSVLKEVEQFLNIRPFFQERLFHYDDQKGFFCPNVEGRPDQSCMSKNKGRPHPNIDEKVVRSLHEYYEDFDYELEDMLKKSFSWM